MATPGAIIGALAAGVCMALVIVPFWALMRWIVRRREARREAKQAAKAAGYAAQFKRDEDRLEASMQAERSRRS